MKRKSASHFFRTGGCTKFLIFSYVISALLVLSGNPAVWAKPPTTAKIVFMSKRDGNAEIYIMNPDGSEQVNLTQHPAADYNPAWSPNGKHILFSSDRDGIFDLFLMDPDGTNVRKVFKSSKYRMDAGLVPRRQTDRLRTRRSRKGKTTIWDAICPLRRPHALRRDSKWRLR